MDSCVTSINSIKQIYEQYDVFIFDMDGVLWQGNSAIPAGISAVNFLMESQKQVYFYTNNSTKSRQDYVQRLATYGIIVDQSKVYASSYIVATYAKKILKTKKAYVVGMKGIRDELDQIGIAQLSCDDHNDQKSMTYEMYEELVIPSDLDAVIVGYDQFFNYYKLCYASKCIQNGAKFVATNPDSNVMVGGFKMPAGGCLVAAIAYSLAIEPIQVGKPATFGFELICEEKNLSDKKRIVMIGDNLETDIAFGLNSGIDTVVVLTGVSSREQALNSKAKYLAESLF